MFLTYFHFYLRYISSRVYSTTRPVNEVNLPGSFLSIRVRSIIPGFGTIDCLLFWRPALPRQDIGDDEFDD